MFDELVVTTTVMKWIQPLPVRLGFIDPHSYVRTGNREKIRPETADNCSELL